MKSKNFIFLFLLLVSIVLIGCSNDSLLGGDVADTGKDALAKCLTEKGIKMYGTEWCPHCKNQKELFGDSFKQVDYIDCDKRKSECAQAGIKGYPTWIIEGEKYPGVQQLGKLATLSNCRLT
ncbi:hypothetical protein GOV03_00955 [Candidatus Woesearchaeota archaeon]|nr:hypothetical protein [Candidatus Woesearchaeota archaeon]